MSGQTQQSSKVKNSLFRPIVVAITIAITFLQPSRPLPSDPHCLSAMKKKAHKEPRAEEPAGEEEVSKAAAEGAGKLSKKDRGS